VKIVQTAQPDIFASTADASGTLAHNLSSECYWHRDFPYSSSLTGIGSRELADGFERTTGKQWNQQLGITMSLFDVAVHAIENAGNPKSNELVQDSMNRLKTTTMVGKVDFTGSFRNVSPTSVIGTQWVTSPAGSKYPLDLVITEHANDPAVPIGATLRPVR
jgi:branched-chain amino acid transport system substrate-binding protein